jgi:Transposase DNA-binding
MLGLFRASLVNGFANAQLQDQSLHTRLLQLNKASARQPEASIPKATGSLG